MVAQLLQTPSVPMAGRSLTILRQLGLHDRVSALYCTYQHGDTVMKIEAGKTYKTLVTNNEVQVVKVTRSLVTYTNKIGARITTTKEHFINFHSEI